MSKLKSRKFLLSVASLLGSIAAAVAGLATDSQAIVMIGVVCGVVSTSIYTICEAMIDKEGSGNE